MVQIDNGRMIKGLVEASIKGVQDMFKGVKLRLSAHKLTFPPPPSLGIFTPLDTPLLQDFVAEVIVSFSRVILD